MFENPPAQTERQAFRDIYTVSRLNFEVRTILESGFPLLWIEAELSNLKRYSSGHWYFSLKDTGAQVRCAMFRNRNSLVGFTPRDGMQVLVRAKVGLYEPRGDFQLIIEHMEEAGEGALRRAFDELKQKLEKEGLFSNAHKQLLPVMPRRVGVITSPSGAAVRDIITTLQRRFPALPVIIYPTAGQGVDAAPQITQALQTAAKRNECDVLILARGGGSLEDLWSFNDERVARAIHACPIPVVTGIGHEIDFTIADFVADRRAPTPTGAAEMVSPDSTTINQRLQQFSARLARQFQGLLRYQQQSLEGLKKRLQHPGRRLEMLSQRIDDLDLRIKKVIRTELRYAENLILNKYEQLQQHSPIHSLAQNKIRIHAHTHRLQLVMRQQLVLAQTQFRQASHALHTISPLSTLSRGYSILSNVENNIIRRASQVNVGDHIKATLAEGQLSCEVKHIYEET